MKGPFYKWFKRKEEGQAMVEFALVFPILLLLLLGILEFGHIFFSYLVIQNATRDGARNGSVWATDQEITQIVEQKTEVLDQNNLSLSISPSPSSRERGERISVVIDYKVPLLAPLWRNILPNPFPITAKTVMRIE
ncbi:MAG: TadE/TadG family type IV pilus assembly protein [Tepidibacillus sp.]|uniref:TadE/TadG family type IV pilus assembly protein n=1 Tax=Tepidibacillus sp. HK-1 TaxID=1883407 RepID=UPI0008539DBB|nr:TadE family protein [Tepidibacillus sp. HK-1]GBF10519.1 tadE-like protein [Tepidibacillus sp. HK-1]